MKYLIVQDWPSTHGNHAGMLHMCNLLQEMYPQDYKVIVKACPVDIKEIGWIGTRFLRRRIRKIYEKWIYPYSFVKLVKKNVPYFSENDEVFLLEYLFPETSQFQLAKYLRKRYPEIKIYALSHLTPTFAEKKYKNYPTLIRKWSVPIDKMLTLGSSLSMYFEMNGVSCKKISTGFHYVDKVYYHPSQNKKNNVTLKVITIGAMARNYPLLSEIVASTSDVEWIICKGNKNVDGLFPATPNVHVLGFLSEDELRHQMDMADVSISVMDDTIGSNVITTALAMGLAQVVSDTGSIRDYCTTENAIFCQNTVDDFVKAINYLSTHRAEVEVMKNAALQQAKCFSVENVNEWFSSLNK